MVYDKKIVSFDVLLDRSFAELTQCAPVPANFKAGVEFLVLRGSPDKRSVTARMVPGQSGENCFHSGLSKFHLARRLRWFVFDHQDVLAVQHYLVALVQNLAN